MYLSFVDLVFHDPISPTDLITNDKVYMALGFCS